MTNEVNLTLPTAPLRHLFGEPTSRFGMMPLITLLQLAVEPIDTRLGIEGLSAKIN